MKGKKKIKIKAGKGTWITDILENEDDVVKRRRVYVSMIICASTVSEYTAI